MAAFSGCLALYAPAQLVPCTHSSTEGLRHKALMPDKLALKPSFSISRTKFSAVRLEKNVTAPAVPLAMASRHTGLK